MLLSVSASTLPQLFEEAAAQLLACLLNPAEIGETLREKVVVDAEDLSSLLEAWLNAVLGLVRDQQILPKRLTVQKIDTAPGNPTASGPTSSANSLIRTATPFASGRRNSKSANPRFRARPPAGPHKSLYKTFELYRI